MIPVGLHEEIEKRLEALALLEYLSDLEDFYIARKRLISSHQRTSRSISIEALLQEYGLKN